MTNTVPGLNLWDRPGVLERAKALWLEGVTTRNMAKILTQEFRTFIGRNAVIGKAHRAGWHLERPRPRIKVPPPADTPTVPQSRPPSAPRRALAPSSTPRTKRPPVNGHAPREGMSLLDLPLSLTACRWPLGDGPAELFCGIAKAADNLPYCPKHQAIAETKSRPPKIDRFLRWR
jgi:hypothetical protein